MQYIPFALTLPHSSEGSFLAGGKILIRVDTEEVALTQHWVD